MRIHKNDVTVDVYTSTATPGASGRMVHTYTKTYTGASVDIQPIKGRFNPEIYGLDKTPDNGKVLFFDSDITIGKGDIISYGSQTYRVEGSVPWYSHQEGIMVPHKVTLP